jgi:7,8-dihydroneopterin aldolase/epimerase/oxygenase
MPDQILIEALELSAHLGVPDDERALPQRLTATLVLEPARTFHDLGDDIANAVNYFDVSRAVQALCRERPRRLLETLAEEIAALLLARFPLRAVELTLRKYILPDTEFVAARIRRESPAAPPGGGVFSSNP